MTNNDSITYWFVLLQDEEGTLYNEIIGQNHSYFSITETKNSFSVNKKLFLLDFKKIELVDSTVTTSTYWFVVCNINDTKINAVMEQKHLYFSFEEAKKFFNENGYKNVFIMNYTQISKETFLKD